MLIILGGLPGVGETTLARELARQIDAVHVRIDTIEQALRDAGALAGEMEDAGYRVAYAVASASSSTRPDGRYPTMCACCASACRFSCSRLLRIRHPARHRERGDR